MSNEDDLQWNRTSKRRWPQIIKSQISQEPLVGSDSNLKLKFMGLNQKGTNVSKYWIQPLEEDNLNWKMTSKYERQISQQPLIGSYSNLKLKLLVLNIMVQRWQMKNLQLKTTSKYEKCNISATTGWILLKLETKDYGTKTKDTTVSNEDDIQ